MVRTALWTIFHKIQIVFKNEIEMFKDRPIPQT